MEQANRPIGVFDSGVGGISALQAMIRILPREHFIYYGDTAHAPYGTKSTEAVISCVHADTDHLLERELFHSMGGDFQGFHVLPLVTKEGEVFILAGTLRGQEQPENVQGLVDQCVREGMHHAEEYRGLHLRMKSSRILPSIYALCTDYQG